MFEGGNMSMPFERPSALGTLLALAVLALIPGCGRKGDADFLRPDAILFNGKIVTVDKNFSIAQAVAVKDGKFVAVGANDRIKSTAGSHTEMVDLEGKTVLPGFNDPH